MAAWLLWMLAVAILTAALVLLLAVRLPDCGEEAHVTVKEGGVAAGDEGADVQKLENAVVEKEEISEEAVVERSGVCEQVQQPRTLVLKIVVAAAPGGQDGSELQELMLQVETESGGGVGAAGAVVKGIVEQLSEISGQGSGDGGCLNVGSKFRAVVINGVEVDEACLRRIIASLPGALSAAESDKPLSFGLVSHVDGSRSCNTVFDVEGANEAPAQAELGALLPVIDLESDVPPAEALTEVATDLTSKETTEEMSEGEAEISAEGGDVVDTGMEEPLDVLGVASDGVEFWQISVAEAVKPTEDPPDGGSADIAAALAALNLDCIDGNDTSMTDEHASSGSCSQDYPETNAVADAGQQTNMLEDVHGEGSGSERGIEEADDQQSVSASKGGEDDNLDAKKREKKKKKNRGKRQKAKSMNSAATSVSEIERKVIEKLTVEHLRALAEIEVGCSCKTARGGAHTISCPYPFTSSGSMVQRKIKEQYDELVRSNAGRTLTLAQVGRFTTCLVEAKTALQQKSETIQRRFTIAKSLLAKADKSSFDRLCGQIYGLEIEQKKLEEDTTVYNRLQEQLKLSPAYQKMLEYGRTHFEMQVSTGRLVEKQKADSNDISFEELLAQEKKDAFWQKHSPARASVPVV